MIKNPPIIKKVVRAMGGTIEEFAPERGCFYINIYGKRILIERKMSLIRESSVSHRMTAYKDLTDRLLREYGLPTPDTKYFYKRLFKKETAIEKLRLLKYPIIIKDAKGSNSKGIFPLIENVDDALLTIESQLPRYGSLIAQHMVFGKEYRLLVLNEKVIAALEMIPPYIVGDGKSTVKELIEKKQQKTASETAFDEKLKKILTDQNTSLESIPNDTVKIFIKKNSSLAEGGEMADSTDMVHPEIQRLCVKASKAVGRYLSGVDVICENIAIEPKQQSFNILELNGNPDLYIHYKPSHGQSRDVVRDIVRFMVELSK